MFKQVSEFVSNRRNLAIIGGVSAVGVGSYVWKSRRDSSSISPSVQPQGSPSTFETRMLAMGSRLLQSKDALKGFDLYLLGFHPMKSNPCHQMEAHHYCKQVNEDFTQCLLFDANTSDANLIGIEYIISERLFEGLTNEEKAYWHPHNYEIMSGMLKTPGLPETVELEVMKKELNSYGKTFHTWRAKCFEGDAPYIDTLPLGPAIHAWSFNHHHEIKPEILSDSDRFFSVNTDDKSKRREKVLLKHCRPQEGVEAITPLYRNARALRAIPGVKDKHVAESRDKGRDQAEYRQ
jgi:hypothetical protein